MIRAHAGEIHAVAFSPDGATFASGGTDGRVSLWDAGDGRLLYTLHGHQSGVTSLAWSPNGKQLASGSADRSVRLWDVPTPRKPIVLCGPPEAVHTLVWSNDDRVLTSINAKDGRTTSWDRLTNATVQAIPVGSGLWDAASPDGRFIAVPVLKDGFVVIRIHDILQQRDLGELTSELTKLKALVWSPDSSRLAAFDKRLQVWAIPQVRPLFNWQGVDINSLAWTADSSRLAVAGNGDPVENGYEKRMGFVHVFDMDGQTRVLKLRLGRERVSAECVAWHPDGILVASGNENGLVMVWDSTTGRLEVSSHLHIRRIRALDWTPDGRRIASVSEDGTLKIWDCRTGDELLSLTDSGDPLTAVKWSSDGKQLATGDEVGRVQIWDATVAYAVFSGAGQPRVRSRMYEERALRLIELTELPDAAVQLSEAINLSPGRASYRRLRGLIYLRLGRLEEALADLAVAVDLAPDDPAVLNSRVAIYAARGEWGEAIPDALRLVELQQSGFERHELALLYLLFGRHDRYREVCQQIFAVDHDELIPSTAEKGAWTCAIIPQSLPNLKNIVRQTREAYAWPGPVTQSSVDGKMSLGALLYRVGQTEEAIAELTKASRDWEFDVPVVNPFDALPAYGWYFLAMAHHDLGHYQQARKWFDKAEAYAKTALAKPAAIREIPLPGAIYWHQRVVLEHLQREARMVLNVAGFKANPGGK